MGEATMGQQWSNCRRSGSAGLARCQSKQLYYSMGGCFVLIWRRGVIDDTSLHPNNTTLCFIMKHRNGWIVISYTSAREESVMCIVHCALCILTTYNFVEISIIRCVSSPTWLPKFCWKMSIFISSQHVVREVTGCNSLGQGDFFSKSQLLENVSLHSAVHHRVIATA